MLSARKFRTTLSSEGGDIVMHRPVPNARPGFVHEYKAWNYYRRSLPEWYLWWGSNPFSYEQTWSVHMFSPVSRSLAQLGAIIQGTHPRIHVLVSDENRAQVAALVSVRRHLMGVAASVTLGLVVVVVSLRAERRRAPARVIADA